MNNNLMICPYCEEEINKESIRCEYCYELIKENYVILNNSLIHNSYHVLGLDTSSSQKQISKRVKEILKYLAIGEVPHYENDLYFTNKYRNEILVKTALDNLTSPKEKIVNTFFWFDIENEEDKNIYSIYNTKNYDKVIDLIKKSNNKKNLAILYALLLLDPNTDFNSSNYINDSLKLFKEIQDNSKFWEIFEKKYFLFDDISTNKELITEFRGDLGKYLSNIFYDISTKLGDDTILKTFHSYFKNIKGNKTNEKVEKIYLELNKLSRKLEDMNISEDGVFDDNEKNQVKEIHKNISNQLYKLKDIGLYEDSKTLLIRDTVAEAFRTIMLDLNNELNEEDEALKVLNYAIDIVGTDGLKHKIKEEYKTITSNIKFKPIIQLLNDENFIGASEQVEKLEKEKLSTEDQRYLKNLKKRAVFGRLGKLFIDGKDLFDKEKFSEALKYFTSIEELAKNNVELFEGINPEGLENLLNNIREYLSNVEIGKLNAKEVFDHIDTIRADVLERLGEEDGYFFIFYIDSITYGFLSNLYSNPKKFKKPTILFTWWGIGVSIYGDTTYFTFFRIPLAPINTWNVENLGNGQYKFYGKKEMPNWKKIWRFVGWTAILIYILVLMGEGSSGGSNYSSSYNNYSSNNIHTSSDIDTNSDIDTDFSNTIKTTKINTTNKCLFNGVEYTKPSNAHCVQNDPNNAWKCDDGYIEKNNYCWCASGEYSCFGFVDTEELDAQINVLQTEIDNTYVNEYSQSSVNNYNAKVNNMNQLIDKRNKKLNNECICK